MAQATTYSKRTPSKAISKRSTSKEVISQDDLVEIPDAQSTPIVRAAKQKGYMPLLIVGLFLEAFLLGLAFVKINYLKAQPTTNVGVQQQAAGDIDGKFVKIDTGHLPFLGNKDARVSLVEFADFRCPFCEQFYTSTFSQIKKEYIDTGKVKLYFRHYAFLGQASDVAANAAECANDQGKFWDMYNYFYKNQPSESDTSMYNVDTLTQIAGKLKMDTTKFKTCLSSSKDTKKVQDDFTAGSTAGVSGTPTVFINGVAQVGAKPYASFKQVIDDQLKKTSKLFGLF